MTVVGFQNSGPHIFIFELIVLSEISSGKCVIVPVSPHHGKMNPRH